MFCVPSLIIYVYLKNTKYILKGDFKTEGMRIGKSVIFDDETDKITKFF